MNSRTLTTVGTLCLVLAGGLAVAQTDTQTDTPGASPEFVLKRVMLSTGGVGYFEYETQVAGDAALSFRIGRDQVDDVLKSIVVYDDQGTIASISLPGQEPLRERFRGLPFDPDQLSSPQQLLNALRGAEVQVTGADGSDVTGRLMSVNPEQQQLAEGGTITRHRVTLLTGTGLRQFILEDAAGFAFTDPVLAAQIDAALNALIQYDDADSRVLTARLSGDTDRTVRLAYVVEAPLWKATYRLTLSNDPASDTAGVQGWAVLENLSGEDWIDVELSVVSGNPVTFRQALYDAYYVNRPQVPVEVLGRVLPTVDTGGIGAPSEFLRNLQEEASRSVTAPGAVGMPAPAPTADAYAPTNFAQLLAAEASDAATQVVFRVPYPISVAAGESILVPIVAQDFAAERLSLYQPDTHGRHPLASVRLANGSGMGLPPGVLTLYERDAATRGVSYLGDAQLAPFPAGDERIVSFAVDQKVTVDREQQGSQTTEQGRIVNGVLELSVRERRTTRYTIAGAADEDRLVLIEHPRLAGWTLANPPEGLETTATAYRLPVTVPANETVTFEVVLEQERLNRIVLLSTNLNQLYALSTDGQLSDELRAALQELVRLREEVATIARQLQDVQSARAGIVAEQERIRDNLQAVPTDSDLARRYLDSLAEMEDRLEEMSAEIAGLQTEQRAADERLNAYLSSLTL